MFTSICAVLQIRLVNYGEKYLPFLREYYQDQLSA